MLEIIFCKDTLKLLQRTLKRIRRRELLRTEEITAIYALAGHGCIVAKAFSGLYMQETYFLQNRDKLRPRRELQINQSQKRPKRLDNLKTRRTQGQISARTPFGRVTIDMRVASSEKWRLPRQASEWSIRTKRKKFEVSQASNRSVNKLKY